jgi:hypothetical protein
MDVNETQLSSKGSNPAVLQQPKPEDDRKEVAWAFLGLLLWSGVVLEALFGTGYLLGHSVLHLW